MDTELREYLDSMFGALGARLERLENRMERLETRMDQFETRMDQLENRMDQFETRMDQLENRMDQLENQLSDIDAKGQERFDRLFRITGEQFEALGNQLGQRLDSLERRIDTLEVRVTEGFRTTDDRFASMTPRFGLLSGAITDLREQVVGLANRTGHFGDRLDKVEVNFVTMNEHIYELAVEMRQRFRSVKEILA